NIHCLTISGRVNASQTFCGGWGRVMDAVAVLLSGMITSVFVPGRILGRLRRPDLQKRATRYAEIADSYGGVLAPARSARNYGLRLFEPSSALAPFIAHYWLVDWDLPEGRSYEAEVLPRPHVNLALMPDRGWITGITTGRYTYTCRGRSGVFGVGFRPGGFRPFFGRPVAALADSTIEASAIFPAMTEAA